MTALFVHDSGPATTVQDLGRPGARRMGVPLSGTLAPDWLRIANALVGAHADAAALEIRLAGPRFEVEGDGLRAAVGGPAEMRVDGPDRALTVPPWTAIALRPGETVTVGPVRGAPFALLAVSGGIDTPEVLGSRSTYARARIGGLEGRALRAGDRVPAGPSAPALPLALPRAPEDSGAPIRVVLGPQDDHFTAEALEEFLGSGFEATTEADRMGMRLTGPALAHRAPDCAQIVSDGICPGAVQVPGNGAPIVLLADGQTIGGYPKIATVIGADLPRLARCAPGAGVRFAAVTIAEAEAALRDHAAAIDDIVRSARPAPAEGLDLSRLYAANLVDGVVDVARPDHFPGHLFGSG